MVCLSWRQANGQIITAGMSIKIRTSVDSNTRKSRCSSTRFSKSTSTLIWKKPQKAWLINLKTNSRKLTRPSRSNHYLNITSSKTDHTVCSLKGRKMLRVMKLMHIWWHSERVKKVTRHSLKLKMMLNKVAINPKNSQFIILQRQRQLRMILNTQTCSSRQSSRANCKWTTRSSFRRSR